jgi:hypothetical protein
MSAKPPQEAQHIRFPTALVILVLATIGFIVFWQLVLHGSLRGPTPEAVVREYLQFSLPRLDGFQVIETFPPHELTPANPREQPRAALLRMRFQAHDVNGRLGIFDKVFFVVGDEVHSVTDWTPDFEKNLGPLLEKPCLDKPSKK